MSNAPLPRILVVDDEVVLKTALCNGLRDKGYDVLGFTSAKEALAALQTGKVDVLLTDLMMPEMDGITLLREASKLDGDLVTIVLTGEGTIATAVEAMKVGAMDYVLKPFKLSVIIPLLLRALEVRRLRLQKTELESRLRQRTADLEVANRELKAANEELNAFAYSVAHDLRAPLRAIHNFTNIVLEDYGEKLGAEATQLLGGAISAAKRMERLLHGLLALGRVSRRELRLGLVDVEQLLHEIIRERPEWQPPNAHVIIEKPLLAMRGDESSLTQCLTNLVGNAVKFVAPGTIPWVRICSQAQEGNGRLWIEDNGIGIQMDNNTRLFETFQRMPEARGYDGEGVGLAIVRRAVERMGGRVGVESEPGKGSRFWIELPVAAEGAVHIS